jgi:arylsulfatase A-like enzyme
MKKSNLVDMKKLRLSFLLVMWSMLSLFTSCTRTASPASPTPNILFILADDWSFPYAGIYGDSMVRTPNLDLLAKTGVTFTHAFCASPSCTPSRSAILTGKYPHNLGEGVNLVGKLDTSEITYAKLLRQQGYAVAFERKGWAPGKFEKMGYKENPSGHQQAFNSFIDSIGTQQPFCFWWGTNDPHRPYDRGSGTRRGIDSTRLSIPSFLPDVPEVRGDLADYFAEIERLDEEIGVLLKKLKAKGLLENTMIVITGDNGMPFPHAKANLYDYGTRVPLLISFPKFFQQNKRSETFVNLIDLAPTFLEIAHNTKPLKMDGKSLVPILTGKTAEHHSEVFLERERHCLCRKNELGYPGYPIRALRDKRFLYISNLRPERMPAGDATIPGTPSEYGDVDGGPTKAYLMEHAKDAAIKPFFQMGFEKRPAIELYDVQSDPFNVHNLANDPKYARVQKELKTKMEQWMKDNKDPRRDGGGDEIDTYPTYDKAWITKWSIIFFDK